MDSTNNEEQKWTEPDLEHHYFGDDKKFFKEERKRKQAQDRSKYKKTDQKKRKKSLDGKEKKEGLQQGRVLSIHSVGITVQSDDKLYLCSLRGIFKKEKTQAKNLIAVGDFVHFDKTADDEGVIYDVEPRKSILSRADNLSRRKEQIIAANIDQVLITVSVVNPVLKPFLVDRYIIATKKGGMAPIILVNKVDLLEKSELDPTLIEQKQLFEDFVAAYSKIGIPLILLSGETGKGIKKLKEVMKDKASVFSGQSGVGKSTLINQLTGLDLEVGKTVEKTKKGAHTTTMAQLIPLECGGLCIDTPGIKSFGVWDLKKEEIEEYFQEINEVGKMCKYPNCSHTHESLCAVKEAVEEGKVTPLRYDSYRSLIETIEEKHKRR